MHAPARSASLPAIGSCMTSRDAELSVVQPRVACCLGPNAAPAVLGRDLRVSGQRGPCFAPADGVETAATIQMSAVLSAADRDETYSGLVRDLLTVADRLAGR
jgi:uracil-DNA glycosylase